MKNFMILLVLVCGILMVPATTFSQAVEWANKFIITENSAAKGGFFGGDGDRDNPLQWIDWSITNYIHGNDPTFDDMIISTNVGDFMNAADWYERMRITKGGDVGIGTPSPTRRLQVESTSSGGAVYGEHTPSGNYGYLGGHAYAVFGKDEESGNSGYIGSRYNGVSGQAEWGNGVSGFSTQLTGVRGESTEGVGVRGLNTLSFNYGVLGSPNYGAFGEHISGNSGYLGGSEYGAYGHGFGSTGVGVWGESDNVSGVVGRSVNFVGVYGWSDGGHGVQGTTISGYGVYGWSSNYDFYAGGPGTNYGPFTGGHEVKLSDYFPEYIQPGMLVSVTGEAHVRKQEDGSISISSTLPTVTLSREENDKAVFGVFGGESPLPEEHWYKCRDGERFGKINALGEGRVWVSNINGDIEAGDYITTSRIPGYGQLQADDLLHSYTLGKAIETVNWDTAPETVEYNGYVYKIYLIAVVYTSG